MENPGLDNLFQTAISHHQAGRLDEAEGLYRRILAEKPDHAAALHLLGGVAHQRGQSETAIELMKRSLAINPDDFGAWHNLGEVYRKIRKYGEAEGCYLRALKLKGDFAQAYEHLGMALLEMERFAEAAAASARAVQLNPMNADLWFDVGLANQKMNRPGEANEAYRRALILKPNHAMSWNNLGMLERDKGETESARGCFIRAIQIDGTYVDAWSNLGLLEKSAGRIEEAAVCYRKAAQLRPGEYERWSRLGDALRILERPIDAEEAYRRALELAPEKWETLNNLGAVLLQMNRTAEAWEVFKEAQKVNPKSAMATHYEALIAMVRGEIQEAKDCFLKGLEIDPGDMAMLDNWAYFVNFCPEYGPVEVLREQARWEAKVFKPEIRPHENERSLSRKLRVGYVSGNFWDHVVARNVLPVLRHHGREGFELTCYSNSAKADAFTGKMRSEVERWRTIAGLSDEQAARMIREDGIDILVDLTLHMVGNRLGVFAHKPAPVQATWAGYPGTTGLGEIDYRLSDPWIDPEGREGFYSEKTVRLNRGFWCFEPGEEERGLEIFPPPVVKNGFVTFGCLNAVNKLSDRTLSMWREVLEGVKGSRILLLADLPESRERISRELGGRADYISRRPRLEYLKVYHRIDLMLDSYPYNGHSTTIDAMWMGVPAVSLMGETAVSRGGYSLLSNVGMGRWVASTREEFVKKVMELAGDGEMLGKIRFELREKMKQSPMMDAAGFTRDLEAAYREMWRGWVER